MIRQQWTPLRPGGRGKAGPYSETVIQPCLKINALFQLPYRATEGWVKSLMRLCQLDLPVPDHTHVSRKAARLSVKIPRRPPDQVERKVSQVSADGAYDSHGCHAAIAERNARATIALREGAVAWGNDHPRDAILQDIEAKGPAGWKNESGYHRRSIAENMIRRLPQLGNRFYSRTFERQATEAHVRAATLNTFTYHGMPKSVRVGQVAPTA